MADTWIALFLIVTVLALTALLDCVSSMIKNRRLPSGTQPFPWPLSEDHHFDRVWSERDVEQNKRDKERRDAQHAHSAAMSRLGDE